MAKSLVMSYSSKVARILELPYSCVRLPSRDGFFFSVTVAPRENSVHFNRATCCPGIVGLWLVGWVPPVQDRNIDSGLHPELHITYRKLCNVTTWM